MSKKENELTQAERKQIKEDVDEHSNVEQAAYDNEVSESVVRRICGLEMR